MGKTLDKIMEASRRGCIEDWDQIEKILREIAGLSIREMEMMFGKKIAERGKIMAEVFLNEEYEFGLNENVIETVELTDILCLVDRTAMPIKDYESDMKWRKYCYGNIRLKEPVRYACMNLIFHTFQEGQKRNALFRRFWCLSIEELMEGLNILDFVRRQKEEEEREACKESDEELWEELAEEFYEDYEESVEEWDAAGGSERKSYEELKEEFYKKADDLQIGIKPGVTVGEVLKQAGKVKNESWLPSKPLEDYYGKVLTAWEIIDFLLIESFRFCDPERFRLDAVLEKYVKQHDDRQEKRWLCCHGKKDIYGKFPQY